METKRKKYQGVINILSFNRHFYVYGISLLAIIIVNYLMLQWSTTLFWLIIAAFIYGLIMPLIISVYIYDFSGYYDFNWLKKLNIKDSSENQLININAGFDETSFIIKSHFPKSNLKVFDFYNAERHTEPAIIRARKISSIYPKTQQIKSDTIPLKDKSVDVIFLLSAAHEIRDYKEKIEFLKECHRLCKPNAKVVMVEHLRDLPNFMVFTIGFTHFFSKNTWKKVFKKAGFSTFDETKFTSFMSVFTCLP